MTVARTQISSLIFLKFSSSFDVSCVCCETASSNSLIRSTIGVESVGNDDDHCSGGCTASTLVIPLPNAFLSFKLITLLSCDESEYIPLHAAVEIAKCEITEKE